MTINIELSPFDLFDKWYEKAKESEPSDPNAMTLASVSADGRPSARIVLLKEWDEHGYIFYTNFESRKAQEVFATNNVALCFHWKSLKKQIRIEGTASPVSDEQAQAYFDTRPRMSRIGAWASMQSRPLDKRETFEQRITDFDAQFDGQEFFPKPPHWSGFRITPENFEFWEELDFRLHNRFVFTKNSANEWIPQRLYP